MIYTGQTKRQVNRIRDEFGLRWGLNNRYEIKASKAETFTVEIYENQMFVDPEIEREPSVVGQGIQDYVSKYWPSSTGRSDLVHN
jgi:hypothetical protein